MDAKLAGLIDRLEKAVERLEKNGGQSSTTSTTPNSSGSTSTTGSSGQVSFAQFEASATQWQALSDAVADADVTELVKRSRIFLI